MTAECLHGAPPSYLRQSPPQPLVELPAKACSRRQSTPTPRGSGPPNVLKQCAAAIMQAVFTPAAAPAFAPVAAPLPDFPAAAEMAMGCEM